MDNDNRNFQDEIRYLEGIINKERDRDKTIENKLSQVRNQSTIIVTLTGLYLPILKGMSTVSIDWIAYCTFVLVPINLILFGISILVSRKSLNISEYKYAIQDEDLVIQKQGVPFLKEQIQDLLFIIKNNRKLTNKKGTSLIWAHRTFYFGLIGTFLLTILFIFNLIPK